jgi:hypothetical protein
MQRLGAKALVWSALSLCAAGAVGGTGCTAKKPTELVPGVSSQMVVPKDIAGISVEVIANGRQVFCTGYLVSPATHIVDLPSTLGVIPAQSADTVVKITIRGYDAEGVNGGDFMNCMGAAVGGGATTPTKDSPRILRRSIQTYVDQHTLFLPMPLSYACQDKDCPEGSTCKGNQCVDAKIDATTLVDFDPTLIDGTGLCFSPMQCFSDVVPAAPVDIDRCIFGVPAWDTSAVDPALGTGVNVQVFYQDWTLRENTSLTGKPFEQVIANAGETEILNVDDPGCGQPGKPACEGFTVLASSDAGAAAPEASLVSDAGDAGLNYNPGGLRIQLAKGLCDLVQAGRTPPASPAKGHTLTYHTISDIKIASACQPKQPLLPICAAERNNNPVLPDSSTTGDGVCNVSVPLTPAPSVLYLVMDQTAVMHGALGPGGSVTTLALSFNDPLFKRTYAGFKFMTGNDGECTTAAGQPTGYVTPDVPQCVPTPGSPNCTFGLVASVQPLVAGKLAGWMAPEALGALCYADADCPASAPYCYKKDQVVAEGGAPEGGADAGGDAGFTQGNCANPQSLDLQAAMRLNEGTYAQLLSVASGLPAPGVAAVMFFVNRVPQTALGAPPVGAGDAGTGDAGAGDAGTGEAGLPDAGDAAPPIPAQPAPVAAQDCRQAPPGVSMTASTPGDSTTIPPEALAAQQVLESEAFSAFTSSAQGLQTYFVVLDNDRHDKSALHFFQQIETDLQQSSGAKPVITLNATDVSTSALSAGGANQAAIDEATQFSQVITKLGTCLYELPQGITATMPPSSLQVQYSQPVPPGVVLPPGSNPPVPVPFAAGCNAAAALGGDAGTGPDGWSFDGNRIRICGKSCDDLRSLVGSLTGLALSGGTPPDVPVLITPLCGGTASDATTGGGG